MLKTYAGCTAASESKSKILEYRWSRIKKKILEESLWQVSQDGKGRICLDVLAASRAIDREQHRPNQMPDKARRGHYFPENLGP